MSESRLTKGICKARPRGTYVDLIGEVLQKGQVRNTRNQRACMIRCMNVEEARGVCKDRSRWCSVVSVYPHGKKALVYNVLCISKLS